MMNSLRLYLTILLAYCCVLVPAQATEQWETNYNAALEQAAKENKMVLLDFTGSDWCGWCIKLKKDTFSKPEFQKFAEGKSWNLWSWTSRAIRRKTQS